jgi:hypothetical protein
MQYIEPRQVSLDVNGQSINGTIQGSEDSVRFTSQDHTFLRHFPNGKFDSMDVTERNSTSQQRDIVEAARNEINSLLGIR